MNEQDSHFERFRTGFQDLFSGNFLRNPWMKKQYRLFLLIFCLLIVYIYNDYSAQRQEQYRAQLDNEIEDARFEYLTLSANLTEQTRQSVIAQKLADSGSPIKISVTPAKRIK